jgi:cellulose synthase/poly-beta-1,6-N-acetylglucosamine synthase-like glycosyltransferase
MTFIVLLFILPITVVTAFFLVEFFVGLPAGSPKAGAPPAPVKATIVVPAHNEASTIAETLARLRQAADGLASILVVADNCDDETAGLARAEQVEVIERNDAANRGKGFALAFAQQHLRSDPPAVVVVIDADCSIDGTSLQALIGQVVADDRPAQTVNLLRNVPGAPSMVQVSNFAFMLKNLIRQRGLQRLAGSVHLTGTGMALPWAVFDQADLATANIVEDIKLGLELTKAGKAPQLAAGAIVWSDPSGSEGTLRQRQRWEGGFLALARRVAPATLSEGLRRGDARLVIRAIDMCVPPLVLLMGLNIAAAAGAAMFAIFGVTPWWPAALQMSVLALAGVAILASWAFYGRQFLAARTLIAIPFYMLWKLPMYLRIRRGSADEWLRAGR